MARRQSWMCVNSVEASWMGSDVDHDHIAECQAVDLPCVAARRRHPGAYRSHADSTIGVGGRSRRNDEWRRVRRRAVNVYRTRSAQSFAADDEGTAVARHCEPQRLEVRTNL